jgi:hypothetical protein
LKTTRKYELINTLGRETLVILKSDCDGVKKTTREGVLSRPALVTIAQDLEMIEEDADCNSHIL